jgi:hypothetical protein
VVNGIDKERRERKRYWETLACEKENQYSKRRTVRKRFQERAWLRQEQKSGG